MKQKNIITTSFLLITLCTAVFAQRMDIAPKLNKTFPNYYQDKGDRTAAQLTKYLVEAQQKQDKPAPALKPFNAEEMSLIVARNMDITYKVQADGSIGKIQQKQTCNSLPLDKEWFISSTKCLEDSPLYIRVGEQSLPCDIINKIETFTYTTILNNQKVTLDLKAIKVNSDILLFKLPASAPLTEHYKDIAMPKIRTANNARDISITLTKSDLSFIGFTGFFSKTATVYKTKVAKGDTFSAQYGAQYIATTEPMLGFPTTVRGQTLWGGANVFLGFMHRKTHKKGFDLFDRGIILFRAILQEDIQSIKDIIQSQDVLAWQRISKQIIN